MNYSNLKFRRQFIFTDQKISPLPSWNLEKINWNKKQFHLLCHPDLEYTHAKANLTIYLLGYILDPFKPDLTNSDIIKSFAKEDTFNDVLKRTDTYNGRYVMILFNDKELITFNDATASKQLFYTQTPDQFYLGSTPNLINEFAKLERNNNEELHEFLNSEKFRNKNTAWFGNETPFENLFSLSPNHYRNLTSNKTIRFWPREDLVPISLKESVNNASEIIKGTLIAASKRYKLHTSITGGWDSRVLLASSKEIKDSVEYYTFVNDKILKENKHDILIPNKLAEKYDLSYNQIPIDHIDIEDEFLKVFKNNSVFNRNVYTHIYYKYIDAGYENHMNVTGTLGDQLLKVLFRIRGDVTAQKFAEYFGVSNYPYCVKAIDKWLQEANALKYKNSIDIADWFNWEVFSPNWAGISATEHDIARDELRVFNCREIITSTTQLKDKYRYKTSPKVHEMIIKNNWEELLNFSVEASSVPFRNIKKVLRFIGIESHLDNLSKTLKYWVKNIAQAGKTRRTAEVG